MIREMMFGSKDLFEYGECPRCGALELLTVPTDLALYYPQDYYSFMPAKARSTIKTAIRAKRIAQELGRSNILGRLLKGRLLPPYVEWFKTMEIGFEASILDVGCGAGDLLHELETVGFKNLTGIDPFIKENQTTGVSLKIFRETVFQHQGQYQAVMLHHSFEHMADPIGVFTQLFRLLAPGGRLLIRTPVSDCQAWREYGVNWVQLDAPRHLFIHSRMSLRLLGEKTGLELFEVVDDSQAVQFRSSELYRRGIPFVSHSEYSAFSNAEEEAFIERAKEMNRQNSGDQAAFFFRRTR